jgi:predicted esterase
MVDPVDVVRVLIFVRSTMTEKLHDGGITTDLAVKAEIELYYDVYSPPGGGRNLPLLIAVHGYGAHKRYMMREARAVADDQYVIASIEAPHPHYRPTPDGYRIGYGWLSDERPAQHIELHHKFVNGVIASLSDDGLIDASRIFLYGFSQSCALNFRFALTYTDVLAGIIGVCGGIPGDIDTNDTYEPFGARTLYLYGDDDEFYTNEKFAGFDERLRSMLPNYIGKQYAARHEITEEMRQDIREFLKS